MTFFTFVQYASGISTIIGLIIFLVTPIRERVLGFKAVKNAQKCQLRADMLSIYYDNREGHTIRQYEFENFVYEYEAYKAMKGNSFIDKIYEEVKQWEVIT